MKFFCPRCQEPIAGTGEGSHATCPGCGLQVDLALIHTSAGRPQIPVVLDHTGDRIGAYRLERCLGSGGMGTVYQAVDTRSGARVAVKLLFPQLAALDHLVARFRREARALRELVHPRIVGFIEEGESDGHLFLVMEYIEGDSLERVMRQRDIPPAEALVITEQICEALDAAHQKGIVHRDLKPANIVLSAEGARVLDFGIAHMTTDDRTLTHSDAILGTVNYMSPEQRSAGQAVDHRSDLYSAGVILYRLLTGKLPLGAFEAATRLNPSLTRGHNRLLARLLQPDPDRRPQTASELLGELRRLTRPGWRPVRWAAALALGLGAGAGLYLLASSAPIDQDETPKEVEVAGSPARPAGQAGGKSALTRDEMAAAPPEPVPTESAGKDGPQPPVDEGSEDEPDPKAREKTAPASTRKPGISRKIRPVGNKRRTAAKQKPLSKEPQAASSQGTANDWMTVPADGVPLHQEPLLKSPLVRDLANGERLRRVKITKDKTGTVWMLVRTEKGEKGYVPYRALQRKRSKKKVSK